MCSALPPTTPILGLQSCCCPLGLFILLRGSDVCVSFPAQTPEWTWQICEVCSSPSFSQPFWNTCCRIPFLFSTQAARGKATAIRNQGSPEDKRKTGSWRPLLRTRKLSALLETSAHVRLNQCLIHRLPPLSHSTVILLLLRYYSGLP